MATTKLGNTKSASRAINYAEKRAVEKSGLNCDVDYAKSAFKQTRALYVKENGIQAHTIIQSFKPGEVTPEQCNQLGLELAEKIAPNHQVAVYTHADTDHVHNHIVINSIDLETGRKYQSNKRQRELVKKQMMIYVFLIIYPFQTGRHKFATLRQKKGLSLIEKSTLGKMNYVN